ncbi:MAG: flavodoxin domain-containing protein [Clostridiales bacterium]|nr:flavodoxin domain-containing protein [Clostridiales bacterium]
MKTIILYATKHGAAAEIARRIAERIEGAESYDLKQGSFPGLAGYDCVIVGASLYAGMMRKQAKAFLAQNAHVLRNKRLGLFLSGMNFSKEKEAFEANVPRDILQNAKAAGFLGGIFDPQKAGVLERFVMRAAAKQSAYTDIIDDGRIGQFVRDLTS